MINGRVQNVPAPRADFGNCNSLILRCANPKCASGGCTDMSVATPIAAGCVSASDACKKYGDDLVQYIAAQLVANSAAAQHAQQAQVEMARAQADAAAAAANNEQIAQMQQQMQQMQATMAAQNQEAIDKLQAALDEQKQLTADAMAAANANANATTSTPTDTTPGQPTTNADGTVMGGISAAQRIAAENGIDADILAREQISGQILSKLENAKVSLEKLKTTMQTAFAYAGCDRKGNNCTGPKRVKTFKDKALQFLDPYDAVVDELYDALIDAQTVGVDITDIYMMLSNSCNRWGKYMCNTTMHGYEQTYYEPREVTTETNENNTTKKTNGTEYVAVKRTIYAWPRYDDTNCDTRSGKSTPSETTRGGYPCYQGQTIPAPDDPTCTLLTMLDDTTTVQRNWLDASMGEMDEKIRVGCASSALENSKFFRRKTSKQQSTLDIDVLERMLTQDAPVARATTIWGNTNPDPTAKDFDTLHYCMIGDKEYSDLQRVVATKRLPKNVCMSEIQAKRQATNASPIYADAFAAQFNAASKCETEFNNATLVLPCNDGDQAIYKACKCPTNDKCPIQRPYDSIDECMCHEYSESAAQQKDKWDGHSCNCGTGKIYDRNTYKCMDVNAYCNKYASTQDKTYTYANGKCTEKSDEN